VTRHGQPPILAGFSGERLGSLFDPPAHGGCRGVNPGIGVADPAFASKLVDIIVDIVRHPGVATCRITAFRIFASDLEEPAFSFFAPPELGWSRIVDLIGAKPAPTHQLNGDLAFPTPLIASGLLKMSEFVLGEPAFRDVSRIVDSYHIGLSETIRSLF
jgi:hypothetical protein